MLLATAALIRDPAALDANIVAGILTLAGIPLGTLGLALTIATAVAQRRPRPRRGGMRQGSSTP